MTKILGISAYYHDSAACLVADGRIIAAAQEERFSRKKHDDRFPKNAVAYCLKEGGISAGELDFIGFYEKPLIKFDRLLETYVAYAPRGLRSFIPAMSTWLTQKLWIEDLIRKELKCEKTPVLFGEHHESHAASAFYPSPFEEAAVLTMDAVGEWATSSVGFGKANSLKLIKEMRFPHSLGMLYSAFTYFTGFKVNSGEYKLMGLAPYGEPAYVKTIRDHLVDIHEDGSITLNMDYFTYCQTLKMTGKKFEKLFGAPARAPEAAITKREMDIARSIQEVTEEIMLRMSRYAKEQTKARYLCLAGGVALNCVGNGRILREAGFDDIWIQPAAGDAGGALGVALSLWHHYLGKPRESAQAKGLWQPRKSVASTAQTSIPAYADSMQGSFLGPSFSDEDTGRWLKQQNFPARQMGHEELAATVARQIADGKVIGLVQGRMEFGPRALGGRSIIGDARSPKMQSVMNLKIKFRESFRPFAPAVLREHVHEYFECDAESPYMLLVADVAEKHRLNPPQSRQGEGLSKLGTVRSDIPAVTHVDYSARVQTIRRETNPFFYDVLAAFYKLTGCPVIINTSFNVRGEPIVCKPQDAYRCFMRTHMDTLVLGHLILEKANQPAASEDASWQKEYVLD